MQIRSAQLWQLGVVCAAGWLAACGAVEQRPVHAQGGPEYPCKYVSLETVNGPNDQNFDAITLVASYRFGEPHPATKHSPIAVKFLVTRSRVQDVRDYLQTHPDVICSPDANADYEVRVEPPGVVRVLPTN